MSLRIAIDASRTTVQRQTGTEHYARRLIQALLDANQALGRPHHITLFFRDAPPPGLFSSDKTVETKLLPWPRAWTHLRFAAELWKSRPDLTFVPAHTLPLFFPGQALVTVHDLGYKHFPEAHPAAQRAYLDLTTRFSQARATLVLADSHATAADLAHFYGTPPDKIRVLYPGLDPQPLQADAARIDQARDKYQLPPRYFLFLGTLQPRKNIARIAQAFQRWRSQTGDRETALVLAGGKGWLYDERWTQGVEKLRILGFIDEADKGPLLSGALALVYPSLYEGFGFPVIEAMICKTPVIASNTSSLPELLGEAGVLVDPLDVSGIAAAMRAISEDHDLRTEMIERGTRRAARFSWQASASQLLEVLAEIESMR